jgi:hypothetical protein
MFQVVAGRSMFYVLWFLKPVGLQLPFYRGDCNKMADGQRLMIISSVFLAVDHRQQLSMLSVGRNNNSELLG